MARFRAICFDWRGTLVVNMTTAEWVARALASIERHASTSEVNIIVDKIMGRPDVERLWARGIDSDAEHHRDTYVSYLADAGLDSQLVEALYFEESNTQNSPFADDVYETFSQVFEMGIRIAILSDIHFDIRPAFQETGLDGFVDSYVLSFEHGFQKPDRRIFECVLSSLSVEPQELLMVGDRAPYDGAAVEVGIPTLLVPSLGSRDQCRLHLAVALVRN